MKSLKTVLVLDNEPRMRALLRKHLKAAGFSVLEAVDGDEAIEILRSNQGIDLLILDILLPGKSGVEVFEAIKRYFPMLKIMVSSVYPTEDQELLIWDANDYYYKAEGVSALIEKASRLVEA